MSHRLKVSLIVTGVHTVIVLLVAAAVGSMISEYPESVTLWAPVAMLDLPSSRWFSFMASWWPHEGRFVYGYAIYLAVIGGLQYFLLSFVVCSVVQRMRATKIKRSDEKNGQE
jgi:hypothetical protein